MVEKVPGFCFGYRDSLSAADATEGDLGHVGIGVEGEVGAEGVVDGGDPQSMRAEKL